MPFIIVVVLLSFIFPVNASTYINEIYPYPPSTGDGLEYVELYNDGDAVSTGDYILEDEAGNKLTFLDSLIATSSYTLAQSKNVLNNSGDTVKLKLKDGTLIQTITYPSMGENITYSKCLISDLWTLTAPSKNGQNAICFTPTPTLQPTVDNGVTTVNEDAISISEFVANPEKDTKEWVEIYNSSNTSYYLKNWYIDDTENSGGSPYQFSLDLPANGYNVVELNRDMLNNDKDEVRLLNSNKILVDKTSYSSTKTQMSWGRKGETFCLQAPSRTRPNMSCFEPTAATTATTSVITPTETPADTPPDMLETEPQEIIETFEPTVHPSITTQVLGSASTKSDREPANNRKLYFIAVLVGVIIVTSIILFVRIRNDVEKDD